MLTDGQIFLALLFAFPAGVFAVNLAKQLYI